MRLDFVKMHGLGNDFIVFDAPRNGVLPDAQALRRLADRHTGIGFDQALVISPPHSPDSAIYYRIFNSDGSEIEQCGNGARCLAALVNRRAGKGPGEVRMDSPAGRIEARVRPDGLVSVRMGIPDFNPRALPFEAQAEADTYSLHAAGQELRIGAVSMGNPHAVLRVDSVDAAPVDSVGPAVENHPRFPRRTNVEFMQILSPGHIRLRVYERGAGETRACGTGACGAAVMGRRWGLLQEEVAVDLPGGRLLVNWAGAGSPVWLTGPTATVFEGRVEIESQGTQQT